MISSGAAEIPEDVTGSQRTLLTALAEHVAATPESFDAATRTRGFEIRRPGGRPRIYFFAEGKDRVVAFFYKPSRLDFSHDRFSYGALYFYGGILGDATPLDEGLAYLAADFRPAERPRRLKRSINFTVPDA